MFKKDHDGHRVANAKIITVDRSDTDFLKNIARSLNKQVRLLWNPAPSRQNPAVEPTEVMIVAEEMCLVDYALYELSKHRETRGTPAPERVGPAKPIVTF